MNARHYLKGCQLLIWPEPLSVLKLRTATHDCIAIIRSPGEFTAVAVTGSIQEAIVIEEEKGWRAITFDAVLPFELVGFLATVAGVLAEAGISIFALSGYSTDHILVKEEQLEHALDQLMQLGCTLK